MAADDGIAALVATVLPQAAGDGRATVLSDRRDALVVRTGQVVAKVHPEGTDGRLLARRLRLAAAFPRLFLEPLITDVLRHGDRMVTLWPAATALTLDDLDDVPWAEAGCLLAQLHRVTTPPTGRSLVAGAPGRVASTVATLRAAFPAGAVLTAPVRAVLAAAATLPGPPPMPQVLLHGDWHLGQLVLTGGGWRLIDVDELGVGHPAWDLARPAAFYAAGLLDPAAWRTFLSAYRDGGGPAVPPSGDPWPAVDAVARAAAVQVAARALIACLRDHRSPEPDEERFLTCAAALAGDTPPPP